MDADKGDPQTYAIIGAAMDVHSTLGNGFLEAVYQQALAMEFTQRNIPFVREAEIQVYYKNQRLSVDYRADFVCFDSVIIELKAIGTLGNNEIAQLLNYLKATGFERGLLFNFGTSQLQHKRMIFSHRNDQHAELKKPTIHR
jgi:GxxExxY protein